MQKPDLQSVLKCAAEVAAANEKLEAGNLNEAEQMGLAIGQLDWAAELQREVQSER